MARSFDTNLPASSYRSRLAHVAYFLMNFKGTEVGKLREDKTRAKEKYCKGFVFKYSKTKVAKPKLPLLLLLLLVLGSH